MSGRRRRPRTWSQVYLQLAALMLAALVAAVLLGQLL